MIALLLLLLEGKVVEPVRRSDRECRAQYVEQCLEDRGRGAEDPDCSVPCQYVPDKCRINVIIYKSFRSSPQALLRIDYMNEDCGADPPRIESKTAIIHKREIYEDEEAHECQEAAEWEPCLNGCPCRSFMAWVRGLPGEHFIQVWGENEGYAGVVVELHKGKPDPARVKIGGGGR